MNEETVRTRARRPSRIESALIRWLMREATVTRVQQLSSHFRLIDLEGEALKEAVWAPGDKLQVMMGSLVKARTYTPMLWDAAQGRTQLLAWSHGDGPGSLWADGVVVGDACQLFGPRRSLDTSAEGAMTLIGDETGFALGAALQGKARLVFEVSDSAECRTVLDRLGLEATLARRTPDDAHLAEIERDLGSDGLFLLTGRAQAIQRIGRTLKDAGVPPARIRSKAYWAPGKTGMD